MILKINLELEKLITKKMCFRRKLLASIDILNFFLPFEARAAGSFILNGSVTFFFFFFFFFFYNTVSLIS